MPPLAVADFLEHGKGNDCPGVRGTLWAAYNGVTELIDHRRTKQTPDRRLDAVWFGDGDHVKGRALRVARAKFQVWANSSAGKEYDQSAWSDVGRIWYLA